MPIAPFGDDLWLTPGIRSMLRKFKSRLIVLVQRISSAFARRNAMA